MNEPDDRALRDLLSRGKYDTSAGPRRDLWPQMQRRLDRPPRGVPWFDWALAALVLGSLPFVTGAVPLLLYHL